MAQPKPNVFVGSSSEAEDLAWKFSDALHSKATMTPWSLAPDFAAGSGTLDSLIDACDQYDFGLFILSADDKIESRGHENRSARDNVLFEYGLFVGKLGRGRTFAVIQEGASEEEKVKVPSDLLGINIPRFEKGNEHETIASVRAAAGRIAPVIERLGRRTTIKLRAKSWGYKRATNTFRMTLDKVDLELNKEKLAASQLVLVAKLRAEGIAVEDDRKIIVGSPRKFSRFPITDDVPLTAQSKRILGKAVQGDVIDGYLFLVPEEFDRTKVKAISDIMKGGGVLLESRGVSV